MKKLTNVSPFLLLLVPVFVMMILTFTTARENENQELTVKSTSSVPTVKSLTSALSR